MCDDGNVANGDTCNPTCNFSNTTTLFAGTPGTSGAADGLPSTARFGGASDIAVDADFIWVADAANRTIRRVAIVTGEVVTVAGGGTISAYLDSAVGLDARFAGGLRGIATDGTTVWIGDEGNRRLRAMSTTSPFAVTTVAGSGSAVALDGVGLAAGFNGLSGMVYAGGFVYVVDGNSATLRRFDPATLQVVTLAGAAGVTGYVDGPGLVARFVSPRNVTQGASETLYIADTNGATIRAYNIATLEVTTVAGNGTPGYVDGVFGVARVDRPRGLTFDGASVYLAEQFQQTVRQIVVADGSVSTMVGAHCDGINSPACPGAYIEGTGIGARLSSPWDLGYHAPSNSLFIFDAGNFVLRRIN